MTRQLKYPIKIAGNLFPTGTIVELLDANVDSIQDMFPGIQTKIESEQIAVMFPHMSHPTILHKKQIMI